MRKKSEENIDTAALLKMKKKKKNVRTQDPHALFYRNVLLCSASLPTHWASISRSEEEGGRKKKEHVQEETRKKAFNGGGATVWG